MEQFAEAVRLLLSVEGQQQATAIQQKEALQFLDEFKRSPDGWVQCAQIIADAQQGDPTLRFQSLGVLEFVIQSRYGELDAQQVALLRQALYQWSVSLAEGKIVDASHIRNKVAQVLVLLFFHEFPEVWPTFFSDHISLIVVGGPPVMDYFLRILDAIDEKIVDREISRSEAERTRNSNLKDAMRLNAMADIAETWLKCLQAYGETQPELCCKCLQIMKKYVTWVDINLFVNEHVIPLLFGLISSSVQLRADACNCIRGIIEKGMDGQAKSEIINRLELINYTTSWTVNIENDEENEFIVAVASLHSAMGTNLLDALNKCGGNPEFERVYQAQMLACLPLMFTLLGHEYDEVSESVMPFVQDYVQYLKQRGGVPEKDNLSELIKVLFAKMRFDDEYDFENEDDEEEAEFLEFRKNLRIIITNVAQLNQDLVLEEGLQCVRRNLEPAAIVSGQLSPIDIELGLSVVFEMGGIVTNPFPAENTNFSPMYLMMTIVMDSGVNNHAHPAVALQFFEVCARLGGYFKVNQQQIPAALTSFLGASGLRNASSRVRSRACYLLSRFVKQHIRDLVHPFMSAVFEELQPFISVDSRVEELISFRDQEFLFESIGSMVVSQGVPHEQQQSLMESIINPLLDRFENIRKTILVLKDPQEQTRLGAVFEHIPCILTSLTKALSKPNILEASGCKAILIRALEIFVAGMQESILREHLRRGVRTYLHRLIQCMAEAILPYIPTVLSVMFPGEGGAMDDLRDTLALVSQLVMKFKANFHDVLNKIIMVLIQAIFSVLHQEIDPLDKYTLEEHGVLRRYYFELLSNAVSNDLIRVFVSEENIGSCLTLVNTVIEGTVNAGDAKGQRMCFSILKKFVQEWMGKSVLPSFDQIVFSHIVPACFQALMQPDFNFKDGLCHLAGIEAAACLKAVYGVNGPALVQYLQNFLPSLGIPQDVALECIATVGEGDKKQLYQVLKRIALLLAKPN
eukprot:m.152352 g.152352  ORF g.152352 m.152352 type:complete len:972 (-) comp15052_c0_seq1:171-3086(-)